MAIVVIGGHSRNIGKTSLVAELIAALPERRWMAAKITQHAHDVRSPGLKLLDRAAAYQSWAIFEERDRSGKSDTSRFLLAGAEHALWVRTLPGKLAQAMPALRRAIAAAENVILESNSVMKFLRPDLYLVVLDYATADFKPSALRYLPLASAIIAHGAPPGGRPAWRGASLKVMEGKPTFRVEPPQYVTPELVAFVRRELAQAERQHRPIAPGSFS